MLAGMQKAMSDLETHIVKLEKAQLIIYASPPPPLSIILNNGHNAQQSASTPTSQKRVRITNSSSDEDLNKPPIHIDLKTQAIIKE